MVAAVGELTQLCEEKTCGFEPAFVSLQAPADYMDRFLDRLNDQTTREVLDRLVEALQARHEAVYDMLKRLDVNGDGQLDKAEIRRGLLGMRIALTSSELDSVIRAFDTQGKGSINYLEFYHVIQKHRVQKATTPRRTSFSTSFRWEVSTLLADCPIHFGSWSLSFHLIEAACCRKIAAMQI